MEKILVIIWKWSALSKSVPVDRIMVTDSPNTLLIRVLQESWENTCKELFSEIKEAKHIQFHFHDKLFDESDFELALQYFPHAKCFLFGGGSTDRIYFNKDNKGIIDQLGDLACGFFDLNHQEDVFVCVYDQFSEEEQIQVKKYYFDSVWDYYEYQFEDKLSSLADDLYYYCFNEIEVHTKYPVDVWQALFSKNEPLKQRLIEFISIEDSDLSLKGLFESNRALLQSEHKEDFLFHPSKTYLQQYTEIWESYLKLRNILLPIGIVNSPQTTLMISLNEVNDLFENLKSIFNQSQTQ